MTSKRSDFIFKNRPILFQNWNGENFRVSIPCIVLCHKETNIAVAYPCFERWYISWVETTAKKSETYRKKACAITAFLNYILWNSSATYLQDVTLKDITGFLKDYRIKQSKNKKNKDPEPRSPEEWNRGILTVYTFLTTFYNYNHAKLYFSYNPVDLFRSQPKKDVGKDKKRNKQELLCRHFGVQRPQKTDKKSRFLPEHFLEIILNVAKIYDPMLLLPIALQSFGGLRKGEVVNLTRASISMKYGGYGMINKIVVDITKPAPFALDYKGSSNFGSIKVPRMQEIYPIFNDRIVHMLKDHLNLLEKLNVPDTPASPLLINRLGNPLTVSAYTARIKTLFTNHFLPTLIRLESYDVGNPSYYDYYEAYRLKYPGAHMFRHWFTMFLIHHLPRSTDEELILLVSKWRGDRNLDSMSAYIHANSDEILRFHTVATNFQRSWINEVL